jgi:GDP-L-fucose synthase
VPPGPIPLDAKVYVAGHRGLVGSALWRRLEARGHTRLVGRSSGELDLRDRDAVFAFFARERPQVVVNAAARVGGIFANTSHPAEFMSDNLRIQLNLVDAAHAHDVERFLFLASSRTYPEDAPQPIVESSLLTGPFEPALESYGVAKVAGIKHLAALRAQFGREYVSAIPTNLYGPGDSFAIPGAHVVPMLVRRLHEAAERGDETFTIYGSGRPRRELLYADDLADACLVILERYAGAEPINVGSGEEVTIDELTHAIAAVVGYQGTFVHDETKPDGAMRKLLDSSRLAALGWQPRVPLREGLARTYAWFVEHRDDART